MVAPTVSLSTAKPVRFHIPIVVWGDEYTDLMCRYVFGSLLALGNLPSWSYTTIIPIYAPPEQHEAIANHPNYKYLAELGHVTFEHRHLDIPPPHTDSCAWMRLYHEDSLKQAYKSNAAVIMLSPDILMSGDTFTELSKLIDKGKRLVICNGLRVIFRGQNRLLGGNGNGAVNHSSTECVNLWVKLMHPISVACFFDALNFTRLPSNLFWCDTDGVIKGRCAHQHPLMILDPVPSLTEQSIDGNYLDAWYHHKEKIHIVTDNRITLLSLTPDDANPGWRNHPKDQPTMSRDDRLSHTEFFVNRQCQPIHRWFFKQELTFTGSFTYAEVNAHVQSINRRTIKWDDLNFISADELNPQR